MFTYSFKKSQQYSPHRYQRREQYVRDAHAIFEVLQQFPERPIPLITPLPDQIITFHFEKALTDSMLERLAKGGYQCLNK